MVMYNLSGPECSAVLILRNIDTLLMSDELFLDSV
jgi:hypothetical protein